MLETGQRLNISNFSQGGAKADILDWSLILPVFSLVAIGLVSVYSATFDSESSKIFLKQSVFVGVGLSLMVIAMFVPAKRVFQMAYPLYGVSIVLLVAVLLVGTTINGQQCWIKIGSFTFQPSEFAKLATLMAVARYIHSKNGAVQNLSELITLASIIGIPIVLILRESDAGTASAFIGMMIGVLLWIGFDSLLLYAIVLVGPMVLFGMYSSYYGNKWYYAVALAASVGAFFFRKNLFLTIAVSLLFVSIGFGTDFVYNRLPDHQQSRIRTFFEPEKNPRGAGYHVIQSVMSVGSGGLVGKGFLKGTQTQLRYIPEQWSDFIFTVTTEEFGFVGGMLVIGMYLWLLLRIYSLGSQLNNIFESIVCVGFGTLILYHTFVNIGMAVGLVPVIGIPLPFMSAGGTAIMVNLLAMGLLLNFYRNYRRND